MNTRPERKSDEPRLVVGIGASAGGLPAVKRFLEAMPEQSGIAFIVVMHLDPSRESHITEIFRTSTEMEVVQAGDEQRLEPDHVYVIAPDRTLEIRERRLCSTGPRAPHGEHKPVDTLLATLAADYGKRAVGIILSGTGNNGSSSIRDLEARGGLCLAQDPETADYAGMPKNAIATGGVDYVLSPEEMPAVLLRFRDDPEAVRRAKPAPETGTRGAFDRILDLLSRRYGVNFKSSYKRGTLERRAERRMGLKQVSSFEAYLEVLHKDPSEVATLYRDVLIGVTEFFRDPEVWDHLEAEVIPRLITEHRDEHVPLKIWVPGCATGEEPYSFAIVLLEQLERLGRSMKIQIFASDVAEDALATARKGLYPTTIEQTVSPARLERFFRREGDAFVVGRDVRETVTFATHNLLADPPFSGLHLVSCRNVLIYLEAHAQQRVLQMFHFALKPGGDLLLGASETIGQQGDLFETISQRSRAYRSSATTEAARHHGLQWHRAAPTYRIPPGTQAPSPKGPKVSRALEQIVLSRYTWACVAVSESFEIQSFFGPTHQYLMQPTGQVRMDVLSWAKPGLYPRLRAALERAREKKERVHVTGVRVDRDGESQLIGFTVEPVTPLLGETPLYLVAFRDVPPVPADVAETRESKEPLVHQLEAELKMSREELQSTIEQLESTNEEYRASHEELLSLNEELQSNNEELQASKEELQSLNEEMVTVNRQLEDKNVELRSTNVDMNNLMVSADLPILFLDRDLCVRRFTPATTELMRIVPSDVGRSIEHIKQCFSDSGVIQDSRRVLEKLVPITTDVHTEDDRWYERVVLPYRTEDDRIDGVCIAFYDITVRKNAALEVEQARAYSEAIVETVRTMLVVLDRDLRVLSANSAFYQAFRVGESETEYERLYQLSKGQWNIPGLRHLLESVLPDSKVVKDYEVEHTFEQIGHRSLLLNARLMKPEGGEPLILLSIEDVTERRAAERVTETRANELVQEHQRKDEFLAMLGHELRNPLSALMHGLELLRPGPGPDDPTRLDRIRGMMTRQAGRIGSMLDQLLDIARLTGGKLEMARAPVDLAEAVQSAAEAVTPLIETNKHELSTRIPPTGELVVEGDLMRLTQVVENLLSNAAKYTEDGGTIELALESDDREARIRVRDTGIGMAPDLIPHIFELFVQAPRTLERAAGGLGLGLPLVKRVVEMHGGTVEAKSAGRGQGSEFLVTLPRLLVGREAEHPQGARSGAKIPRRGHRILVVDDEKDTAAMLAQILEAEGHDTRAVHDGPAALVAAAMFRPGVVLLDLGLPRMDGYEVAKRLRDEHPDENMLLVAVTGYQKDEGRLKQAGFDRHLLKPPDMQKISRWLAGWEREDDRRE